MQRIILALTGTVMAAASVELRVVSGRPDMVSGGTALVEIRGVIETAKVTVFLNGKDVSRAFRPARDGNSLLGRVEGLSRGKNTLRAGNSLLELINHPVKGPVFSGQQQQPFVCETEAAGLGPPIDSDCSVRTVVAYFYKSTEALPPTGAPQRGALPAGFKPYDKEKRPADLAKTTTSNGRTVDYIVRRETGTINRALYAIAFLHDPAEPLPDPWTATPGWNGRLVYAFRGGCGAGYHQGALGGVIADSLQSAGYAVATSSLNVLGTNCDDVTSAETMMMVKEHFIKQFGLPVHTIGIGGSGGSIQQHLIAQNYPGLLDGILPAVSYPDITTIIPSTVDCFLLDHAFKSSGQPWTDEQKAAVAGFASWGTCSSWGRSYSPGWVQPGHCDASLPRALIYHPVTNPKGARCTIYDHEIRTFGRDPKTGFARRPLDNAGVQYGLAAFQAGKITLEQFLDLNERIGGFDPDGNWVATRTQADPAAVRLAYEKGRVNAGAGSLGSIPILDSRNYMDTDANIHDRHRSFVTRARLQAANGNAGNHVIFTFPVKLPPGSRPDEVRLMDEWLSNIGRDRNPGVPAEKIARNRPAGLSDACWTTSGEKIAEPQTFNGPGRCNQLYPNHANPRIAAGAPLTDDILKCNLKAVDPRAYKQPMTAEQTARLKTIFPRGVCDYSRPGIGQRPPNGSWLKYDPIQ